MKANRLFIAIMLVLPTGGFPGSIQTPRTISIDNVTYQVYGNPDNTDMDSIAAFHEIFYRESYAMFARYNVRRPAGFRVNITIGAWLFKELTGRPAATAGLYHCLHDSFYFQRPAALIRKDLLDQTISHEMTHCVIAAARRESGHGSCDDDRAWIEESFCVAMYPSVNAVNSAGSVISISSLSYPGFRSLLRSQAITPYGKDTVQVFRLMRAWGLFLLKRMGEDGFFNAVTAGKETPAIESLYKEFRRNY